MNRCGPVEVEQLLESAGRGATVYLIGVGGCGVSGLGHLLLDLGYRVAGSDLVRNVEVQQLEARGAVIYKGHAAEHLAQAKPLLVVYSSAIRMHNPELDLAQRMQLPIVRRATLLAALLRRQRGICVAGMHGKTTTSALLTFALENLSANPSYAIGALVPQLRRHARYNAGGEVLSLPPARGMPAGSRAGERLFVVEVDESDGTLQEFEPDYSILLNIDEEHMDFYANLEKICAAFRRFAEQTRHFVIYCADDQGLRELLAGQPRTRSFGFDAQADYRLAPATGLTPPAPAPANKFEVWKGNKKFGDFSLSLIGNQNVSDAGAVIAMLDHLGYSPEQIAGAIAGFRGAARRQQELFRDERFRVFDDYGHHPAEIAATLRAFKQIVQGRLLVAFQPHRFTRTQFLLKQFSTCFQQADRLWLTEIYAASEPAIAGINGALLAKAVRDAGQPVEFIPTLQELRQVVRAAMQPGDVVLFLGAGDITTAAHALAAQLRTESGNSAPAQSTDFATALQR